jgi:hypothetical protein
MVSEALQSLVPVSPIPLFSGLCCLLRALIPHRLNLQWDSWQCGTYVLGFCSIRRWVYHCDLCEIDATVVFSPSGAPEAIRHYSALGICNPHNADHRPCIDNECYCPFKHNHLPYLPSRCSGDHSVEHCSSA